MSKLFDPLPQRDLTLRNRIAVAPMCQYSARDGVPDHWHLVHLGSRAVGGAAAVLAEATAVSAAGRISPQDTGLWNDAQLAAWQPIAAFVAAHGAVPGVQLAHAGRKASTRRPWEGSGPLEASQDPWTTVAPSAVPFDDGWHVPQALDAAGIRQVVADFRAAARRALEAGFQLVELHGAHGYLLHQFLSPLSNRRDDAYGGSFDNRTRLLREVVAAVREVWPERLPLWLRISATDWAEGGWTVEESVALARQVRPLGVDLVDVSSGGLVPHVKIPLGPGYQVPFAAQVRREAGVATGAVGLITEPRQAAGIVERSEADVVLVARESLRDPYFPRRAAQALGAHLDAPVQYQRAW
ncbi:NADH:flavin oxidoreductase/NADH oxidase [Fulvimonas sp. R45]|uniref:NADH:flavin oxidoreductase/NADH oxidase n=1 Tax=Fulvimonas sp. R45 TaxID=3045937 RepID=UPI00265E6132|nr:NADH:flavin oxidoreductase/NADH oxidase [Fulvimonas sp. R45]MDO1530318.1 NADH:flavin oxidoreductase/NADH oxidase [Fulvimonas sp. R45]